jgi:alcohol dehydrogenase class IV
MPSSPQDPVAATPFRWQDGDRTIVFARGALAEGSELLEPGFVLLTTPRWSAAVPGLTERAASIHEIPSGRVDELAGSLRSKIEGSSLVALGGGRVIDVAKALAAADPPRRVAAIPTTLSGAEMTAIHRHAVDVPAETPRVRPALVLVDPELAASGPVELLASSAGNALGHALEGPTTPLRNPVAAMAALAAARLIQDGFATDSPDEPGRDSLALGALLAGYVIGSTGYGLHHVVSQTLARFAGVSHGAANTIMLPHTWVALARRVPEWQAQLEATLGHDPRKLAVRLRELSGATRLQNAGASEHDLETCAEQAAKRQELDMTPPRADLGELRALYRAAY